MLTASVAPYVLTAAGTAESSGISPIAVGVGVFVLLAALLGGLVAFGGGRDHS